MLTKLKDWGSSQTATLFLRGKIEKYADLKEIKIDSIAKKLRAVIRPKGEADDVEIRIDKYEILKVKEEVWIIVYQVECSKKWLHLIAIDHLVGKQIGIPPAAAVFL